MRLSPLVRLPSLFVLRPLLVSVLSIWLACHLAASAALQAIWPGPSASALLVPVVPFLFFLDLRIKRLDIFLANLGISRRLLLLGSFLFALGLEVLGTVIAGSLTGGPTL